MPQTETPARATTRAAYNAGAADERERCAQQLDALAAQYPASLFPPASDYWDDAEGTCFRIAYTNAARQLREAGDPLA